MKFTTPNPFQYLTSLLLAALLGVIAYYFLAAQSANDLAFTLAIGLLLGHLAGSFLTRSSDTETASSDAERASLYVGNLAYRVQRDSLQELFARYGNVHSVRIMTDRNTRKPRGYGFVEMDPAGAEKAISKLNNREFCGRPLRVSEARQRSVE